MHLERRALISSSLAEISFSIVGIPARIRLLPAPFSHFLFLEAAENKVVQIYRLPYDVAIPGVAYFKYPLQGKSQLVPTCTTRLSGRIYRKYGN
jgi:hypothetical protein